MAALATLVRPVYLFPIHTLDLTAFARQCESTVRESR